MDLPSSHSHPKLSFFGGGHTHTQKKRKENAFECLRTQTRVKQNFFSVSFREEKRGGKEEEFLKKKKKKKSLLLPFEKRPHF